MFFVVQSNTPVGYTCHNYETREEAMEALPRWLHRSLTEDEKKSVFLEDGATVSLLDRYRNSFCVYTSEEKVESDPHCGIDIDEYRGDML